MTADNLFRSTYFFSFLAVGVLLCQMCRCPANAQGVDTQDDQRRDRIRQLIRRRFQGSGDNTSSGAAGSRTRPTAAMIKVIESTVRSSDQSKQLPIRLTVPTQPGRYPVIVLSHGAGGSGDSNTNLAETWARNSFVCIQPTHQDSIRYKRSQGLPASLKDSMSDSKDPNKWVGRVKDIEDVLNSLPSINALVPNIQFDTNAIGVGGHSFGAFTTQLLAGVAPPQRAGLSNLRDPRIKAILLLSPQGITRGGTLGFDSQAAWRNLNLPCMVVTGALDTGPAGETPDWRVEPFEFAPPGNKFLVFLNGASHMM